MQNISLEADLVASIYEAAVINDRWPSVFAQISALFDLAGGGLAWESPSGQVWMGSDGIQEVLADFAAGGWGSHNERLIRANREGQFSFVQDVDLFTEAEMNSLPIYRDFLHPRGFGYGTGTLITGPLRTPISVVFERKRALGPLPIQTMQVLDRLRPHFARSLVLTSEIERQRAETLLSGLSIVGLPAAVIRDNGQILAANSLFITAQQRVVIQAFDRLTLGDDVANGMLREALSATERDTVKSIPLVADGDDLACIVHILPLSRAARDFAPKGTAIILISQLQKASGHQNYALLKGLYDLTKGEARVASEILTASSLPDIAKRLSLSYETVRSVAKAIYAKTGSNGQADFIHRMGFVERFADGQESDGQSSRE